MRFCNFFFLDVQLNMIRKRKISLNDNLFAAVAEDEGRQTDNDMFFSYRDSISTFVRIDGIFLYDDT